MTINIGLLDNYSKMIYNIGTNNEQQTNDEQRKGDVTMIRIDTETGRKYIDNIPEGKITAITTPDGRKYKVEAQNKNHQDDVWYNGRFIGDCYGVFQYVKPDKGCGFWQQVSPWYYRYGNAERKMFQLAK